MVYLVDLIDAHHYGIVVIIPIAAHHCSIMSRSTGLLRITAVHLVSNQLTLSSQTNFLCRSSVLALLYALGVHVPCAVSVSTIVLL